MNSPKVYKHNPDFKPDSPFLSDQAMVEVFDARPILCVDILFVDRSSKTFLLPKRILKPAEGVWFVGGMIKRDTPPLQSAAKVISCMTGKDAALDRLAYLNASWFEWDYRTDEPTENGRVDYNLCFTYEPTDEEITAIESSLHQDDPRKPEEYDTEHGLTAYNREPLAEAIINDSPNKQVLLDYYDQLFS